jgi:acetyltransferase-like isoleucine patch superfamily enzyme
MMSDSDSVASVGWLHGQLPANVRVGEGSLITGDYFSGDHAFKRFRSKLDPGLIIGRHCLMDSVFFNVSPNGRITIGDECRFQDAFLICDSELRIGNRVQISWRATIVDSDFHPIDPTLRLKDNAALSPGGDTSQRPPFASKMVVIDDDVFIGPLAAILKGVHVGRGAFVEPGAVVTRDVPPGARVLGNPAIVIEQN